MTRTSTYTTWIEIHGLTDQSIDIEIAYKYCPGYAGRLHEPPFEPPEPPTCEVQSVKMTINGEPIPTAASDWIDGLVDWESVGETLLQDHHEKMVAEAEAAADAAYEDRKLAG